MTLQGIDISSNNNFLELAYYRGSIVINKLTGGNSYVWKQNRINDCLKKGLLVGAYHFANENGVITSATRQAKHFYNHYKEYRNKVLPILDYETPINGKYLTQHDMNKVDNFMIKFHKLSGVYPVLYASKSFILNTRIPKFTKNNCMLWFAQYANNNATGFQSDPWTDTNQVDMNVLGQQYTSHGRIRGITGFVDLSIFYITRNNWIKACKSHTK